MLLCGIRGKLKWGEIAYFYVGFDFGIEELGIRKFNELIQTHKVRLQRAMPSQ